MSRATRPDSSSKPPPIPISNLEAALRTRALAFDGGGDVPLPNIKQLKKFVPPVHSGKVVKVYDGDTITVGTGMTIDGEHRFYKFSVRLRGIDCPEMRTRCAGEKEVAVLARDALAARAFGQTVQLKDLDTDKYGRLLANVWHSGTNMSDWLLEQRLAVPYGGGTKTIVDDWREFHRSGALAPPCSDA
jgi:endonuclease YncB( thermonuclease family)